MKRVLLGFLLLAAAVVAEGVTVEQLCRQGKAFEGKDVSLVGTVADYSESSASSLFRLVSGKQSVWVYIGCRRGLHNQMKVAVKGKFSLKKRALSNVVEAELVQAGPRPIQKTAR